VQPEFARQKMQWDYNPTAAPTVPCPKSKNHRNERVISVVFALWDFCLFAIACFLEVPLVLSFQGKNRKKNLIFDVLYCYLLHKLKLKDITDILRRFNKPPQDDEVDATLVEITEFSPLNSNL